MCWYSYLIDLFIGFIAGLAATLWILYIQFKKSASLSILNKIETATLELHTEIDKVQSNEQTGTSTSIIRSKYRPYLGVYIDLLLTSFGGGKIPKAYEENLPVYPCLIHLKHAGNVFEDGWKKFQIEAKHLIEPANAYLFLTKLLLIKYFEPIQKVKTLANLLNQIEKVVGFHDGLLHDDIHGKSIKVIDPKTATKFVIFDKPDDRKDLLQDFEKELETLENNWKSWVKILKL